MSIAGWMWHMIMKERDLKCACRGGKRKTAPPPDGIKTEYCYKEAK